MRLDGRRALVSGASRGIGLACAAALAEAGADVVLAARGREALDEAVAALRAEARAVEGLPLDLADIAATEAAIARHGPFDVFVNSAGIARHGPAFDTAVEDYDMVMATNVRAAYFASRAVAKGLVEAGRGGAIIHVSSQMGHVGGVDRAVYCASKHALEGMVKAMAIEWGKANIRINTVCPTFIRTALTEASFADPVRRDWIMSKIKLPRVGEVEDVMGAIVFLASDAAAMITGTSLLIDGGWTAG
jgi:2-deoxy-D-gluconate 3-dehydrogenase